MNPRRAWSGAALSLAVLGLAALGAVRDAQARGASKPVDAVVNLLNAEGWAQAPPGRDRDRILERWAEFASLPELVYVLRHPSAQLGPVEAILLERAVERCPAARAALRRRLVTRLVGASRDAARRLDLSKELATGPAAAPQASVFRIGLLVPAHGDYADYAASLRAGLEAALTDTARAFAIEPRAYDTGESDPARAIAAFDSAARDCGALVGELLSAPTLLMACGARMLGTPLVSPTATDEAIGAMGPSVFALGPSVYERGARLAAATLGAGRHVGILTAAGAAPGFAAGFADAATAAGADVAWRASYGAGSTTFRQEVKDLVAHGIDVLFWDGETREVEGLLRELAKNKVSVRICGGLALAPDRVHAETRFLLEGVQFVGEDWTLPATSVAGPDSAGREAAVADPVFARGMLAGRLLRAAIRGGALCPEEIAEYLAGRRSRTPYLAAHGFIDLAPDGFSLPIFTVQQGKAVPAP